MKLTVFIATACIQLAAAALGFLGLLFGLNGFSERQATPSLIIYLILAFLSVFGLGAASAYTAKWLVERFSTGKLGASIITILGFVIIGALILFVGFIAALFLAETLRTWK